MPTPHLALLLAPALGTQDFPDLPLGALTTLPTVRAVEEQMAAGDNVVLLANHQSEADPQAR